MLPQIRPTPILAGQQYVVFFCTYQKSLVLLAKRQYGVRSRMAALRAAHKLASSLPKPKGKKRRMKAASSILS